MVLYRHILWFSQFETSVPDVRANSKIFKRVDNNPGGGGNMHRYPSDINRETFEIIRGDLEQAKKRTMLRKKDLYDIFCAIVYLVKSGCRPLISPNGTSSGITREYGQKTAGTVQRRSVRS
jgi:hypothetical protein